MKWCPGILVLTSSGTCIVLSLGPRLFLYKVYDITWLFLVLLIGPGTSLRKPPGTAGTGTSQGVRYDNCTTNPILVETEWLGWCLMLSLLATIWPTGQSPRQVVLYLGLSDLGHRVLDLQQWSKLSGRHEQQELPGATPFPPSLPILIFAILSMVEKWHCYNPLSTNQTSPEYLLHCFLHCRPVTTASGRHVRLGTVSLPAIRRTGEGGGTWFKQIWICISGLDNSVILIVIVLYPSLLIALDVALCHPTCVHCWIHSHFLPRLCVIFTGFNVDRAWGTVHRCIKTEPKQVCTETSTGQGKEKTTEVIGVVSFPHSYVFGKVSKILNVYLSRPLTVLITSTYVW